MTGGGGVRTRSRWLFAVALVVVLAIAGVLSFYASRSPDGLEKVAADKGISKTEKEHEFKDSPLGDYGVKGVDDARLSGGVAGVAGVLLTLAVGGGLFWIVRRRPSDGAHAPETADAGSGMPGRDG